MILEKLHSYGLLDSNATDVAVAGLNKKRALLARRLLCRKCRHLEKSTEKDGFFVERQRMTEETFNKLVDVLDLPVNEAKNRNSTQGINPICKPMVVACTLAEIHTKH
jgi:hypothetical protein